MPEGFILAISRKNQGFPGGPVVGSRLAMQGTCSGFLLQEYPTHCRAIKPLHHNYLSQRSGTATAEPCVLQLLRPEWLKSTLCKQEKPAQGEAHGAQSESGPHSSQLEKAVVQQQRPSTTKNK